MRYVNQGIKLLVLVAVILISGCATSSTSNKSAGDKGGTEYMTLDDHIRRINGVRITGSGDYAKVVLRPRGISGVSRGKTSPRKGEYAFGDSNERQPLFVVDGQKIGRDYPSVRDMFSAGEIKSVRLLVESEASQYGSEAGHGVIEIITKAASNDK